MGHVRWFHYYPLSLCSHRPPQLKPSQTAAGYISTTETPNLPPPPSIWSIWTGFCLESTEKWVAFTTLWLFTLSTLSHSHHAMHRRRGEDGHTHTLNWRSHIWRVDANGWWWALYLARTQCHFPDAHWPQLFHPSPWQYSSFSRL